jgi:hypothetical protein
MTPTVHPASRPATDFTPDHGDWRLSAACRDHPAQWWDHAPDHREDPADRKARHDKAIAICDTCPLWVRDHCLTHGISNREDGIHAGKLLDRGHIQKRHYANARPGRTAPVPECGTNRAYRRHKRNGEIADDACWLAHLEHEKALRARKKRAA